MTSPTSGWRAPALAALATAALFVAALSFQHARNGWPFSLSHGEMPMTAAPGAMGGMEDARSAGPATPGSHERVAIHVRPQAARNLGIRLVTVQTAPMTRTVRAVATVVPDESRLSHVHTRVAGWIEQLFVNTTGQYVRPGQPLARIFSQELLSSQTEYLAARRLVASGIATAVAEGGRTRLSVLGMTPGQIAAIERSGKPMRLVTVVAPHSGVVVNRGISVGTAVDPSTELMTLADLSQVWVLAEVPESDIPSVKVGTRAQLEFAGSGLPAFPARVDFVYPTLSERTRTLRVRMSAPNRGGALRPGLYGTAVFTGYRGEVISVPRDAVVDTGLQQHVFVAEGERYVPRPVKLGTQLSDRVEVVEGLRPGEQIVASGVFLLDSESRLRASGGGSSMPGMDMQDTDGRPAAHSGH